MRKVVSRSNAKATGKYPSWKMLRSLQWESINELHAFRLLDCDPEVIRFEEQPCRVEYLGVDGLHRHFPDILVETHACKELWEVKPVAQAVRPEVALRTEFLVRELPRFGYTYRMVLAHELAEQPCLNNAGILLRFGRNKVPELQREVVRRSIAREGSLTWSDACSGRLGKTGREVVCRMLLEGILEVDMAAPIVPTTVISLRPRAL